jgi:glyoxylase-like metal-dependent hydrolase (beta-lactamase superfamily II)/mannose-6-phosphate isomerase-like protein (cupin superfamily)
MNLLTDSRQKLCHTAWLGFGLLMCISASLRAEAPMQKTQAPGYYRMMLGQYEITALHDGMLDIDSAILQGISESEIKALLDRAWIDNAHKIPTSTNTYLINTGKQLVLVDTGGGKSFAPTLGKLCQNLKASGYTPDQIDVVLITHLHPDHVGGLTNANGQAIFPNATVYVAKAEHDFWFSKELPQNTPADRLEHLKRLRQLTQNMAAPYRDTGRWKTFETEAAELPIAGVKAVPIPGHTPGHTAYEITSEGQSLLILGDTLHCAAIQFPRPDPSVMFDSDARQAVASREALFLRIADSQTFVAGMHLAFPGIGHIHKEGQNAYTWVPLEYSSPNEPVSELPKKEKNMTRFIPQPTVMKAAGQPPKTIEEFVGRVNTKTEAVSIARMKSPSGWSEPGQTPQFDEYTVVLRGCLHLKLKEKEYDLQAGQAIIVSAGEWVQYSTPSPDGAEYIAVCLPAFSPTLAHRDDAKQP